MPAKIYIALAAMVLFLALAVGNPFLPSSSTRPAPREIAVQLVSLRTLRPGIVHAADRPLPPCPDAALQPLVQDVQFDAAGRPRWILRDGRVLWLEGDRVTVSDAAIR